MAYRDMPIRKKLMQIIILISGIVLIVTCAAFSGYEFYAFKKSTKQKLSTIGKIISSNSTAALAFYNSDDAKEILSALKTEPHIVAAALYDKNDRLFAVYTNSSLHDSIPATSMASGYHFVHGYLEGIEPVMQDNKLLGKLYIRSDLGALYDRFKVLGIVSGFLIVLALLLAYILTRLLQKSISRPIMALAQTTRMISERKDYSLRADKRGHDEVGSLTDNFNEMLDQIEVQNKTLQAFNQNLEQKVSERTEQLETVNRELESFSYSISHDLRAPLRGIIGFAAILEEDYSNQLDEEAKRVISVIKENTIKMGRLIDDLLMFSRMGRQDIVKTTIPSLLLVKEIIHDLGGDKNEIRWIIHEIPDVKGDINAMRQVWINLISNAIKYSGKIQQPRLEIGSYKNGKQIVFFVKDNGVGFDEQYKEKLFKVFQRLHREEDFEGTGIGLAIIEKIISKHGGKVWAEGAVNAGSTFYFSLPDE